MSHIVRGKVDLAYTDREVFEKALSTLGTVLTNQQATIALGGGSYKRSGDKYPIVLESSTNTDFRIGFRLENGRFMPYYDEFGALGNWSQRSMAALKDRYIAYHYEKTLKAEGYQVSVQSLPDGSLEVLAEEAVW